MYHFRSSQRTNTPVGIIRIVIDDTVHYQRTKILIKSIVSNKDEWRLSTIEQKTPSDESVGDECSFFLVMNVFPFLFFDSLLLNVLF